MQAGSSTTQQPESFEDQLLQVINRQPRRMLVPLLLSVLLIAGMAAPSQHPYWLAAWLLFACAVMMLRLVLQNPRALPSFLAAEKLRLAVFLVALSGTAHGLSLFFFLAMTPFEQTVLTMVLIAMCAGAVANSAGYRPLFAAYLLPTLCPLALVWALTPGVPGAGWVQGLLPLLIVLFAYVLNSLAHETHRVLRDSYAIRLELRSALDVAQAANRAKTHFLASASHDLRQPIQSLSLFAAALAMRPLDERSRNIANNMNAALQDLTGELDALLDISKLDAGIIRPALSAFALRPALERLEGTFALTARQKGLQLSLHCDCDIWVVTDRKLLDRVLRNLFENAVKYTDSGRISVTAVPQVDGECCVLTVTDTGRGIDASEHQRIFEEFYQINNPGRDRTRGLGLGLSIVRRLADLLGLQLSMSSALGSGTSFTIRLPTTRVEQPEGAAVPAQCDLERGIRVLLIDDEESVRLSLRVLLEEHGCHVALAAGTEEAEAMFPGLEVDLLIADFRLRDDDNGIRSIRTLRAHDPELPAILLTGDTAPNRLQEAQQAGIPVLHKPVSPQLLLQEMIRVSARRHAAHGQ
jgi:signal transduction histidine kinase/CheY-like chemotaxis protein